MAGLYPEGQPDSTIPAHNTRQMPWPARWQPIPIYTNDINTDPVRIQFIDQRTFKNLQLLGAPPCSLADELNSRFQTEVAQEPLTDLEATFLAQLANFMGLGSLDLASVPYVYDTLTIQVS